MYTFFPRFHPNKVNVKSLCLVKHYARRHMEEWRYSSTVALDGVINLTPLPFYH
jgi:hypothetical protein